MLEPGFDPHQRHGGAARLTTHEMRRHRDILRSQHSLLMDQLALLLGGEFGILKVGTGEAGLYEADLYVLFGQFFAKRFRKALYSGFGSDIDGIAALARYGRHPRRTISLPASIRFAAACVVVR